MLQRMQPVLFHSPLVVSQTLGQQMFIQLLEGGHVRQRHHEVATAKAYSLFYSSLFVALAWCAEAAIEQVVAAKDHEGFLLLAIAAF